MDFGVNWPFIRILLPRKYGRKTVHLGTLHQICLKLLEIIQQPEGRRLEFKESIPRPAELAKTVVAFANDAGGDLYVGVRDEPRMVSGIPEDQLLQVEEQISNIIYDYCTPVIVPEISFHGYEDAWIIRVRIVRGSNFPYFLKSKGKSDGTYIRIGSSNRPADEEIIADLERQKRNVSFDAELVFDLPFEAVDIQDFASFFYEKTEEPLDVNTLKKLDLLRVYQGQLLPTNALLLFTSYSVRKGYFPYSKIECARFKGTTPDTFIDQKTIDVHIGAQAELAYEFVLRHINQGAQVTGVYTKTRWEYPVKAIREALRNAVVHRDYSLLGKDIKVAIYDDMVEITSPGKLLPSIDFHDLEARQSDIRNRAIAPVFKKMGIIDQWGNGLRLIAEELKKYPEIGFRWLERGLSFQVQFFKRTIDREAPLNPQEVFSDPGAKSELSRGQVGAKSDFRVEERQEPDLPSAVTVRLLQFALIPRATGELMGLLDWKSRSKFRERYIIPLLKAGLLRRTVPDKPNSSRQRYETTAQGRERINQ